MVLLSILPPMISLSITEAFVMNVLLRRLSSTVPRVTDVFCRILSFTVEFEIVPPTIVSLLRLEFTTLD